MALYIRVQCVPSGMGPTSLCPMPDASAATVRSAQATRSARVRATVSATWVANSGSAAMPASLTKGSMGHPDQLSSRMPMGMPVFALSSRAK